MKTREIRADFGLEILDIDLAAGLSDSQFDEILEHYYRRSLLLFRNQRLTPRRQAELCHRFGQPKIETRKQFNFQEHPEVSTLGNILDAEGKPLTFFARGGFGWHTDGTAACHVDAATLLYAVEVPREGGDTLFLSSADAYDNSPDDLKQALQQVSLLASFHAHNDPLLKSDPDSFVPLTPAEREALPPVWHKVVQIHPVTGRMLYYLNLDPLEFRGVDDETGRQLIDRVVEFASQPQYVYRHRWQPGELLIWDNHAMLHSGTPTLAYESDRRLMHRSFVYTLPTERPLPNYREASRIFMPDSNSIRLAEFDTVQ
jgi:alpha-ketoglutarate-dependent taurine dioxygenase